MISPSDVLARYGIKQFWFVHYDGLDERPDMGADPTIPQVAFVKVSDAMQLAEQVRELEKYAEQLEDDASHLTERLAECAKACDAIADRSKEIAERCNHGNDNDWWEDCLPWMANAALNAASDCAEAIRVLLPKETP